MSTNGQRGAHPNQGLATKTIVLGGMLAILLGSILGVAVHAVGIDPTDADIKYDWIVVRESLRIDGNSHGDIFALATAEGVPVRVDFPSGEIPSSVTHPRLPGAILLQLPVALFPYDWLFALSLGLNLALFLLLLMVSPRIPSPYLQIAVVLGLLVSLPMFLSIRYSSQGALVAGLSLGGWLLSHKGFDKTGGALIGLGAVLKIYPLVLLIPLVRTGRGRQSVSSAVATFLVVNATGLFLPGVSLGEFFGSLSEATAIWIDLPSNASLVAVFAESTPLLIAQALAIISAVLASIFLLRERDEDVAGNPFVWLIIGLLVVPLSWASYDMILIPVVFCLIAEIGFTRRVGIYVLIAWVIPVLLWPFIFFPNGWLVLGARLTMLAIIAVSPVRISGFQAWVLPAASPNLQSRI